LLLTFLEETKDMSLAIPNGGLNSPTPQLKADSTEWLQIDQTLRELAFEYEILDINASRQEILLRFNDPTTFSLDALRGILTQLQNQTQQSFVALVNMGSQCILITVRG
ncbi:MAG: hypothetical protein ACFFBD_00430, partial [Candidatus Hodarchaeota archaeon]